MHSWVNRLRLSMKHKELNQILSQLPLLKLVQPATVKSPLRIQLLQVTRAWIIHCIKTMEDHPGLPQELPSQWLNKSKTMETTHRQFQPTWILWTLHNLIHIALSLRLTSLQVKATILKWPRVANSWSSWKKNTGMKTSWRITGSFRSSAPTTRWTT